MAAELLRELERLPLDWNYDVTRDGRLFFINDQTQSTTWLHPVTGAPLQSGHQPSPGLPAGWEKAVTPDGILYYIDHNGHLTTFEHPATNRPLDQNIRTSRSPVASPRSPSPLTPTHKQNKKSQQKQRNLKAPTARRDENSRITMRGWLHRQEGGSMKTWKRRWCVLADYGLFFYKDDTENVSMGSILLPSFRISECTQSDNANRRYAFKAEHENLRTNYFAADRHEDMNRWIGQLQSAASLKAGLSSPTSEKNNSLKLIPKSPIITWGDDNVSPLSPTSLSSSQFGPGSQSTPNSHQQFQGPGHQHPVHNGGPGYNTTTNTQEQFVGRQQHSPHDGRRDRSPSYPRQKESFPASDADRTGGRNSYPWKSDNYQVPSGSNPMSPDKYDSNMENENPNYPRKSLYSKHPQQQEYRQTNQRETHQQNPEQSNSRFDPERRSYSRMPGDQDPQRLSYSQQVEDGYGPHRQRNSDSENTRYVLQSGVDTDSLGYPQSRSEHIDPQRGRSEHIDPQRGRSEHIDPQRGRSEHIDPQRGRSEHIDPQRGRSEHIDPQRGRSEHIDPQRGRSEHINPQSRSDRRDERSQYPAHTDQISSADQRESSSRFPDYLYPGDRNLQENHQPDSRNSVDTHGQSRSPLERQYQRSQSDDRLDKPDLQDSKYLSHNAPALQDRLGQTKEFASRDSPERRRRSQSEDKLGKPLDNRPVHQSLSGSPDSRNVPQDRQYSHAGNRYAEDQYVSSRERKEETPLSSRQDYKQENNAGFHGQPGSRVSASKDPSGSSQRSDSSLFKDPYSRYLDNRSIDPHHDKYADQNHAAGDPRYDKYADLYQAPRERTFPHRDQKSRNEDRYGDENQRDFPSKNHHDPHSTFDPLRSRDVDNMHDSQEFGSRQHMPQQRDSQSNFPDDRNGHQRYSQSGVSEDSVGYARLQKSDNPLRHNKDLPAKQDTRGEGFRLRERDVPPVHEKIQYAELMHTQPKPVNVDEESPYAVVRKPWPTQKPEPAVNTQQKRFGDDDALSKRFTDSHQPTNKSSLQKSSDLFPHSSPNEQYVHSNYTQTEVPSQSDKNSGDPWKERADFNRDHNDWSRNGLESRRMENYPENDALESNIPLITRSSQDPLSGAPHTYVNVYDGLGGPESLNTSIEGPVRPPLPAEVRHLIVEDIAHNRSPQTSHDYLQAEDNLEKRMKEKPYFEYPSVSSFDEEGEWSGNGIVHPQAKIGYQEIRAVPAQAQFRDPHGQDTGDNGAEQITVTGSGLSGSELDKNSQQSHNQSTDKNGIQDHPGWRNSLTDDKRKSASSIEIQNINQFLEMKSFEEVQEEVQQWQPLKSNSELSQSSSQKSHSDVSPIYTNDTERHSAFRPIDDSEQTMNSLQRLGAMNNLMNVESYVENGEKEMANPNLTDNEVGKNLSEEVIKRFSAASSQQSVSGEEALPGTYPGAWQQAGPGRGLGTGPIHTVKEEPDMPDADVIETELRKLSKDPLTTRGLRMSINAGDLIGKTHDELVLLLIQLRRNQSALEKARDYYRSQLENKRPAEHQYRRQVIESMEPIDSYLESEHAQYSEIRKHCEEVENKLEVYRPLVNLVSNMVTMGSLYGGDNQMMATQYRKHLLSPDQYVPPKKMLEFSRKQQEDKLVKEMEDEVQQLSMEEVDLEDKVDRLCQLDRLIQEYSFKVVTFREDKDLLEKTLHGILKQQDLNRDNPRDLEHLTHQQRTIEKELLLVMNQLAEASKELEEITAENNKVEHEVTLLRSKVHGDLTRSRSAPSLSSENLRVKMKMEKDLAKVQNMMEGLSKEGARLSEAMNTLRRSSSVAKLTTALSSDQFESVGSRKDKTSSYMETDLDTLEAKNLDVGDVSSLPFRSALQIDDDVSPLYQPRSSNLPATSDHQTQEPLSMDHQLSRYDISGYGDLGLVVGAEGDGENSWDIGEADENTKRFYGLIPKDKPKVLTVRDVKRQAEQRRERDKQRKGPDDPRIDSNLSEYSWKQPSGQDQSTESNEIKPMARHWSTLLSQPAASSMTTSGGPPNRKLSLHLMTPRPFVKFQDPSTSNTNIISSDIQASSNPLIMSTNISASHSAPLYSATTHNTRPSFMSHSQPILVGDTPPTFSDLYNVKKSTRGRYLTISSSQPIKLETIFPQPQSSHSAAGDLMINQPVMPDIVKSSTTKADQMDENLIEREILYTPQKVEIPERYNPESDEELTAEEQLRRQEKAEKIQQLLAQQSIHSMSQPDVSKVGGQFHERVEQEKEKRAELLKVGQQLAKQVTLKSRKAAAARRKTWSGSASGGKYNGILGFGGDHIADDQFLQMGYDNPGLQWRDY